MTFTPTRKNSLQVLALAMAGAGLLTLTACGGGGGSSASAPPAAVLSGTAATGAALANASVAITDNTGASPCQETSLTTSALGVYTCTLKPGEVAPFFIVATDPTGNSTPLVSIATTIPASGATLTVNATPLTTAIVAQLASDGNALTVVNSKTVDAAALQQLKTNVLAQLAPVLTSLGAATDYDPFSTTIAAATASNTGNIADQVLDVVKVVTDTSTGKAAITTVDNPTPVVLATATTAGATVPAPAAGVTALAAAQQIAAKVLQACFAVPTAQRVLTTDTTIAMSSGGPAVTSVDPACQSIAASVTNGAGVDFLQNGYNSGQYFYGVLTSNDMTGATFSVPEVIAFYSGNASTTPPENEKAVLNIRYIDNKGNPGSMITVAENLPGTSTTSRPTTWWLTGNGQVADVSVKALIRRVEELNPAVTGVSRFQNGLQFIINAKGPGSITADGTMSHARVTGPGLPAAGLVYVAPVPAEVGQTYMDVSNQAGNVSSPYQCGNNASTVNPTYNCPNFNLARTVGITATTGADTLGTPYGGPMWLQPTTTVTPGSPTKGQRYQVELFYGTKTTPTYVVQKTLLTDLTPVTQAINLQWDTLGTQSLALLDPNNATFNGVLATAPIDWVQNPAAELIRGASITLDTKGSTFGTTQPSLLGSTSLIYNANPSVSAFSTTTSRYLLLAYRTLDNTNKTSLFGYN
jgi:hypothetical protein